MMLPRDLPEVRSGYFFGPPGQMILLPEIRQTLKVSPNRPKTFSTTISGRMLVQRAPRSRRSWDCTIPAMTPSELAQLEAAELAPGAWVTPEAALINVLTPEQTLFLESPVGCAPAGVVQVEPGYMAPSAVATMNTTRPFGGWCPIMPGVRVCVSAWLRGESARIGMREKGTTEAKYGQPVAASGMWVRATAMINTDSYKSGRGEIVTAGATSLAGIAVSWTRELREWGPGRGCGMAVLSIGDEATIRTSPTIQTADFSVQEIG